MTCTSSQFSAFPAQEEASRIPVQESVRPDRRAQQLEMIFAASGQGAGDCPAWIIMEIEASMETNHDFIEGENK